MIEAPARSDWEMNEFSEGTISNFKSFQIEINKIEFSPNYEK